MIYRIHYYTVELGSEGYFFLGSQAEAERARRLWLSPYSKRELAEGLCTCDIEKVPTPTNKTEVLALLMRWASHPDNG